MALQNAFGDIALDASIQEVKTAVQAITTTIDNGVSVSGSTVALDATTLAALETINVANFPASQAVTAISLPLPTGSATESTLIAINTKTPSLGQSLMASSSPVVIASNQTVLPVSLPSDAVTSYSQTGVIAINTDLLIIDCQGLEGVSIHCTSMGTAGVVTPSWSNTNVTAEYINQSIMTPAGVSTTTFNAIGLWVSVKQARYLRLRMTTATTAGTTTINVLGIANGMNFPVQGQPVTGTVTATVASTTVTSSTPVTPTQSFINSAATTNAAAIKASAGTVWSIICSNVNAAARYVKFYNLAVAPTVGTSVPAFTITVPSGQTVQINGGSNGIRFGTGIAIAITGAMADSDTTVVVANEIKVATSYT